MKKEDWYTLCGAAGIGPRKMRRLLETFGRKVDYFRLEDRELREKAHLTAADVLHLREAGRERARYQEEYHKNQERGIRLVLSWEEEYPKRLLCLADAPVCLFVKGAFPEEKRPSVAVIGARSCSEYGRRTALGWSQLLAEAGCGIVSGLALGIDGAAHQGALLSEKGKSYAVLGCGVDMCYPRENHALYEKMPERGGIISEFLPGESPIPKNFPRRNRLISALSDVLVVIEARERSGSLITVQYALEQGREVFALPGRVEDERSRGCLELIRDGATPLLEVEDILRYFEETMPQLSEREKVSSERRILSEEEGRVLRVIGSLPRYVDDIVLEADLPFAAVSAALLSLELDGFLSRTSGNYYRRSGGKGP